MKNIFTEIFHLFFPESCCACRGALVEGENILCTHCRWDIPLTGFCNQKNNPIVDKFGGLIPIEQASSFMYFHSKGGYRKIIHDFKYHGKWRLCCDMGEWYGEHLRESGLYNDIDLIIPIPLHFRRHIWRGYNQSEYLSEGMGKSLGVKVDVQSVVRRHYNRSQVSRNGKQERWDNVTGIFKLRDDHELEGKHILLVDDVLTTGATLISCAQSILRQSPTTRISIATFAVSSHELFTGRKQ